MRLESYDISEDADTLNAKLLTSKCGGCDGRHCTDSAMLGSYRCERAATRSACNMHCSTPCLPAQEATMRLC